MRIGQRFFGGLAVMFICLAAFAKPALSAPASNMATLALALGGDATAIANLNTDLSGNSLALMNLLTTSFGSSAAAITAINNAVAGNAAALTQVQTAVGGTAFSTYVTTTNTTLLNNLYDGLNGNAAAVTALDATLLGNGAAVLSNMTATFGAAAVTQDNAFLNTLTLALGGDAAALASLDTQTGGDAAAFVAQLTTTYGSVAAAQADIALAVGGNAASLTTIRGSIALTTVNPALALLNLSNLNLALGGNANALTTLNTETGGNGAAVLAQLIATYGSAAAAQADVALAIGGDAVALAALGSSMALTPVDPLLVLPSAEALAMTTIDAARLGNVAALNQVRNALGATPVVPALVALNYLYYPVSATDASNLNIIISSSGNVTLNTIQLAIGGNALAIAIVSQVVGSSAAGADFLAGVVGFLAGNGNNAAAATMIQGAIAGTDALAICGISNATSALTSGSYGGFFSANSLNWAQQSSADLTIPANCALPTTAPPIPPPVAPPPPPIASPPSPPQSTGPQNGATATTLTNNCSSGSPDLNGSFAIDPCNLTRDNLSISFAQNFYGGEQVVIFLEDWFLNQYLPALKNMTAQLDASRVDQTRQFGSLLDAQDISRTGRNIQEKEMEEKLRVAPSEGVCVAGSHTAALAKSGSTANALSQGFKQDLEKRSGGVAGTTSAGGMLADQNERWKEYCTEFHDPENNNGVSACPNPTTAGAIVNGDIDIEGLLFKDTINLSNPDEYRASLSLLKNLTQPRIKDKVADNVINSFAGREWILKQQHIESARNIATDVVSSIIAKRSNVTDTNVGVTIRAIRTKAGVDAAKISNDPSYNEIMLAMTKERFFDPDYFIQMHGDIGAMKQEQTMLDAYTSLQMQDIHQLQERINALLAARAGLKFTSDVKKTQVESAPLQ